MASDQQSAVRCPVLLLLVVFGASALLVPIPAYSQDLDSQLLEAAEDGETEKVKALLESGADVNAKDLIGLTPLMLAASLGYTETVATLLEAGANLEAKDILGHTTLGLAESGGHTEVVELLKKAGANE